MDKDSFGAEIVMGMTIAMAVTVLSIFVSVIKPIDIPVIVTMVVAV